MTCHSYSIIPDGCVNAERAALIILRRSIQDQIEADLDRIEGCLAFLDSLDGETDLEDGADAEGHTDDNGLADRDGADEQLGRYPGFIDSPAVFA